MGGRRKRHDLYRPGTAQLAGLVEMLWVSAGSVRLVALLVLWRWLVAPPVLVEVIVLGRTDAMLWYR